MVHRVISEVDIMDLDHLVRVTKSIKVAVKLDSMIERYFHVDEEVHFIDLFMIKVRSLVLNSKVKDFAAVKAEVVIVVVIDHGNYFGKGSLKNVN